MFYTVRDTQGTIVYKGTNQAKAIAAREFCKGTMTAVFIGQSIPSKIRA